MGGDLPHPIAAPAAHRREAAELVDLLRRRIVLLDGGMGTTLHTLDLTADDFGGDSLEGCNEALNLTRPDVIRGVHEGFLAAGSDIVETNTFGGTPIVLGEYAISARAYDINLAGARVAKAAAAAFSTPQKPRFVAGSIGPTTKSLSVMGGVTFDELVASYREQVRGLVDGGADILLVETSLDTLNAKAAGLAIRRHFAEGGVRLPVMLSCTIETMGTMLAGQPVEAFYASTEHLEPISVGLNCSTGPEFMTHHVRTLSELATTFVSCYPNAGLPDENGQFHETPDLIAKKLERFAASGWLNIVGGCCGTTPQHIKLIAEMAEGKAPRQPRTERKLWVSGIDFLAVEEDNRPVIVGERTNVYGSRKFKDLIRAGQWEEAAELGRKQVKSGAQVLDVNLQDTEGGDEGKAYDQFVRLLVKKVKVPLMIDTTDARSIEVALKLTQGKCIINSINLENGEERFERVCPLIRDYGAAVVVGCIDEDKQQSMAITVDRKVAIAQRSFKLLTEKYGLRATDILFDPLVFPAGTGDMNYWGSAAQTIDGVRAIKEALPDCRVLLGISNVSFGLLPSAREVVNAVFLYHCTKAGLDFAIVNSERITRYASIPDDEREAAEDLIFARRKDAVERLTEIFRKKDKAPPKPDAEQLHLTVEQRIARRVVEGTKEGLLDNLNLALEKYTPIEVVNGPLMDGMSEVGRLFNDNQLIVAEVLQSAEVMKAAVSYLEQFMEKTAGPLKAKLLLATVKGDVHDIGKNLVEIILANNGYQIVNLGIKVPSEALIQAYREHKPWAIGLSGLLVKSAQQMVATASDLRAAGVTCPLFIGGAALSRKFAYTKIAPEYDGLVVYAKDAMQGLDLANQLHAEATRPVLEARLRGEYAELRGHEVHEAVVRKGAEETVGPSNVRRDIAIPTPPDLKRHVIRDYSLEELFAWVNPQMLYAKHLGLRGNLQKLLAANDEKALKVVDKVNYVQEAATSRAWMKAHAVFRFFRAAGVGNDLVIYDDDGRSEVERFAFPRQGRGDRLCLADYCAPFDGEARDFVAMFVTTAGEGVRGHVERMKAEGEYYTCHVLQALAIECAESFAELLHGKIRAMWGFPDPPERTIAEKLGGQYQSRRYSFGYPACPRLEDQEKLFRLLAPEKDTGVRLTEGCMMDPEASVSALVFHHPDAHYFGVTEEDMKALEASLR